MPSRSWSFALITLLAGASLVGCDSTEDPCADTSLFYIRSATNTITGQALNEIRIDDASFTPNINNPGGPGGGHGVRVLAPLGENARFEGDVLICDIPCAFGRTAGGYWFRATAPNVEPVGLAFEAEADLLQSACAAGEEYVFEFDVQIPNQ